MSDKPAPDLSMLAALLRQVVAEQANAGDDTRGLTAIAMRQDNTLAALLTEVRAMHAQRSHMADRRCALDARG